MIDSQRKSRRQFMVSGLRVTALMPFLRAPVFAAQSPSEDRVLVVVQLSGGNDGLNTVIPHRQDAYYRLRPTLALARNSVHPLDDSCALHPSLGPLAKLFGEGRLAVVQGAGYPGASRSHFRSMEVWHTADTLQDGSPVPATGWLGRMSDQIGALDSNRLAALQIGTGELPLSLYAERSFAPTARDAKGFQLAGSEEFALARARVLSGGEEEGGELDFLRGAARSSYDAAERMSLAADRSSPVEYPGYGLARELRLVAQLITGGLGTRIFQVELTGFDTHVRQARTHAELLNELGQSLGAFQRDLEQAGCAERVLTLVFSEFGRRVKENGSRGTDHGAGAPVILMGEALVPGLHGRAPDLARLEEGDVPFSTDFRSIYSALERDWMGLRPSSSLTPLDIIRRA